MTRENIVAGKFGFQQAGLMDYGSLYGTDSYFGEDYTAAYPIHLGQHVCEKIARRPYDKPFTELDPDAQTAVQRFMQNDLQGMT